MKKVLSSILLAVLALALLTQPALAKPTDDYDKAITRLEPFLSLTESGNIVLDPPRGVVRSINADVYLNILAGLEQTNLMIDQGYLTAGEDFTLAVTQTYLASVTAELENAYTVVASTYAGVTKVVWYWWGFKVYLSHYNCIRVVAGLGITAAICAMIPEPLASKVAAIIMASLAGTIMVTDIYDRGVIIRFHYIWIIPGVIIYTGMWSQ